MHLLHNGQFLPAQQPVVTADNASFKWGDGVFETIKLRHGRLLLADAHFRRLFQGLALLQINAPEGFTAAALTAALSELCRRNGCSDRARIRLAIYRNEDNTAGYLAEALPLAPAADAWPAEGLDIDVYPHARKAQDALSNLKTANFLPYVLAARFAREKGLGDALVLNGSNRICDSSRANIFIVRKGELFTPGLSEGCIDGVVRRCAIDALKTQGYAVHQQPLTENDILEADEVFLTNSIQDLRSVRRFREKIYGDAFSRQVYDALFPTIYTQDC